jgi:opacity protein-like surface antigen
MMDRISTGRLSLAALAVTLCVLAGLAALAPAAWAQSTTTPRSNDDVGLGFKGIGGRIGVVDPEDASTALDLGFHVDFGEIARNIHIQPLVEYWSVGQDVGPYNADIKDLSFGTDVNFDFPLQDSRFTPYAGGGVGLHFLSASSNIPDVPDQDHTKFGLNLQGGIRSDVMPNLAIFGELRYNFVSDANQLKILGGFTYRFIY